MKVLRTKMTQQLTAAPKSMQQTMRDNLV